MQMKENLSLAAQMQFSSFTSQKIFLMLQITYCQKYAA
jgi:hypothetical protein